MELVRKSALRNNERTVDSLAILNKIVADNHKHIGRQSINPILIEQTPFKCLTETDNLTKQYIETLIKIIENEIIVIGLILPTDTLTKCYKILTGNTLQIEKSDLNGVLLQKHALADTNTLLLLLNEDHLPKQTKIRQKILLNLSFIVITSQKYAKKQFQPSMKKSDLFEKKVESDKKADRQKDRELLIKNSSLMIIKQSNKQISPQTIETFQTFFWQVQTICKTQLDTKLKRTYKEHLKVYRQGYQGLSEETEETYQLVTTLQQMSKISLKRNWKISKGLLCYPFLYYFTVWLRDSTRDTKTLLDNAVNSYSTILEQKFITTIQNLNLPTDELKLRNTLSNEKRSLMLIAHRHLTMLESLFPDLHISQLTLDSLTKFCSQKQQQTYDNNNIEAMKVNDTLLRKIYTDIIETHFEIENPPERKPEQYQSDLKKMMEVYGNEGLRVSSQLKSFNLLFAQKKLDYTENLCRELQTAKKKYVNEKEELKDKLQIQAGVLQKLEGQIKDLLDRRTILEEQNNSLKKAVQQTRTKRTPQLSDSQTTHRKPSSDSQNKSFKKQPKSFGKITKPPKTTRCCCQII